MPVVRLRYFADVIVEEPIPDACHLDFNNDA